MRMKKITSFVVLLAALLLTLPAQAFTWNWAEHETLSFLDMKKVTSRFVPINEATPVQMDAMEAPQSMLPVAKVTRRAAIASIDDIVGDYTWDYKTATTKVADPTTAEATAAQAHVTIAKGTTDGTIVISGMFPNDVKGSVDLSTGLISFEQSALGNFSQGGTDYGSYYFYAQFYNESDSKWYWDSNPVTATVGDDNVITFSNTQWIVRRLKDYSTGNSGLTPYYLPGSTMTPSEPLTPVTPSDPAIASAEEFSMTYYSSSTDTEAKSASVKVAVDGNDVYIQGFSSYLPEAWVKGTKDGNTVTFPKMQYMGEYAGYTSFFFYGGDAVFTYDSETSTYSATGQIFGVLGEQYYDGRYFNPVLTKVVEVAGTPATPSINSLKNGNYGWYFTFNIPLQDTNGNNMVASKVTYKIYTDVNHEVSLLTFTPTTHTKLPQDMSEFPYGFTDNYDFTATSIYLNDLFSTTWHQIGIQSIYTGGGETHESEIGWYKIKEYPTAKDVTISPETGTDISAAISAALGTEGDWAKNVTINLAANGEYTLSKPITSSANVEINGNGATIDASSNTGAIVLMSSTPSVAANSKSFYEVEKFAIKNVIIKSIKSYVYDDNKNAYAFADFAVEGCVFEFNNTKQDIDAPFRFQAGGPVKFTLKDNTMYQKGSFNNKYFVKIGSGNFPDKAFETFAGPYVWDIENNTFYQTIAHGEGTKMAFINGGRIGNNYTKTSITILKNLFIDCAGSDAFLKDLFGGKYNDADRANFVKIDTDYNTYWTEAAAIDVSKYDKGANTIAADPGFKDAANGDFTLAATSAQNTAKTGDPRWISYSITVADGIENGSVVPDVTSAAAGTVVTLTATPAAGYELDAITVTGVTTEIAVTVTDSKFTMPADDVTVNATFKKLPVDVTVEVADITDGDITAAITAKVAGAPVKNLTINLAADGAYKVTAPLVAGGNIAINGNGAVIDASALSGASLFSYSAPSVTPSSAPRRATIKEAWAAAPNPTIEINGVSVEKLAKPLFSYKEATLTRMNISVNDSKVEVTANVFVFDIASSGACVENFSIDKSTFYKVGDATSNAFFTTQTAKKAKDVYDEIASTDILQTITISNSTIYNFAKTKNFFTLAQNSQTYLKFDVKNNIFVNCGKSGQTIKGINGGGQSANPVWDVDGNVFNFDGADTSAAESTGDEAEPVKNSIAGVITFADAAAGNFNGTLLTEAEPAASPVAVGDPRWTIEAKKDTHSKSLNIEQLVLDKTTKADIAAALAEKNIEISSNAGLDSLNDEKTLRNEPFLGLKIKAADATVKVLVKKGNALNVKFGCVNDPVNVAINGTPIDTQVAKNTEGSVFTLPAAEADQEVVFTTTAKNTVVLKQIMIGEDIAAVTLPAATKYQVSVAEGIVNGTVEFAATSMTDSKGYKTVKVGDEVTITATPAEGYELETLTVKGVTSNEAIVVTDGKFTMPADAVTINATFKVSTGINAVKADALKDAQIYNMQGVRVDKAQKGLYIVNGRKVVIK